MYFAVKAFKNSTRRFENLDSLNELNHFMVERIDMGFTKFVVKSYDENGGRFRTFWTINPKTGWVQRIHKEPLIEG